MVETIAVRDGSLAEVLDRLIETGVTAAGDAILGLAGVDLIRLNLRLVLASVETLCPGPRANGAAMAGGYSRQYAGHALTAPAAQQVPAHDPTEALRAPQALDGKGAPRGFGTMHEPRAELGLGALVLAIVDLVRQLFERQAVRRMENGSLTAAEVERLGVALMQLEDRVNELADALGVRRPDSPPVA